MTPSSWSVHPWIASGPRREPDATPGALTLSDILDTPEPSPKRPAHRPPPDEATLRRRRIAAWLVESGTLPRHDVDLLIGVHKNTINRWRAAHRRRSA